MQMSTHIEHVTTGIMSHMLSLGGEYAADLEHLVVPNLCSLTSWSYNFLSNWPFFCARYCLLHMTACWMLHAFLNLN